MKKGFLLLLLVVFASFTYAFSDFLYYFPFDSSSDDINNTLSASWTGTEQYRADNFKEGNTSVRFNIGDGSDYITYNDSTALNGLSAYTICSWVYPGQQVGDRYWFGADTGGGFWFLTAGNGRINTRAKIGGVEYNVFTGTSFYSQDTWYYVCQLYNGTLNLYVDDVFYSSASPSGSTNSDVFEIGRGGTGATTSFDGDVDAFVIYDRALNSTELTTLFLNDGNPLNLSVEPPPVINDSINITSPLDNITVATDKINVTFNVTFEAQTCYLWANDTGVMEIKDNITVGSFNQSFNVTDYDTTILGFWRGESQETGKLFDSSSFDKNATFINSQFNISKGGNGTGNGSIQFNGVDTWAYANNSDNHFSFSDGSDDQPFSISMWAFMDDSRPFRFIGTKDNNRYDWFFTIDGSGYARFQLHDLSAVATLTTTSASAYTTGDLENKWSHWIVTYDGSQIDNGVNIYKDGSLISMSHSTTGSYTAMEGDNPLIEIGALNNGSSIADGLLDDVVIFDVELTTDNITEIYNNGLNNWLNTSTLSEEINQTLNTSELHNLTWDFLAGVNKFAEYLVQCFNGIDLNSTSQFITYLSDTTPPLISFIYPSDGQRVNDTFVSINFTTNEYASCNLNITEFSLNISDGVTHSWLETLLDNGNFNLNVSCSDNFSNTGSSILNFSKDTVLPSITWTTPSAFNTTVIALDSPITLRMDFFDSGLFAYEVLVYDTTGDLRKNFTATGLTPPTYNFIEIINGTEINELGQWDVIATVWDSHTARKKAETKITKLDNNKKLLIEGLERVKFNKNIRGKKNISIEYTGSYPITKLDIIEKFDRNNYRYEFDIDNKGNNPKSYKHSFKLICEDLHFIESSEYPAHIVCFENELWYDAKSDNLLSWDIIDCGNDCVEIELETEPVNTLYFESTGTLNSNTEAHLFTVVETLPEEKPFEFFIDFDTLAGVIFLFILVFVWIALYGLGFTFKNFGFISFAFFVGIILGLMLFTFHIFATILWILLNFAIFWQYSKSAE